jgi:hypothetical protein
MACRARKKQRNGENNARGSEISAVCSTRYFDSQSGEYKIIGQHHIESVAYYLLIKYEEEK